MADGVLPNGARVLPDGWMAESTTPSKGFAGYGYMWWLQSHGGYAASSIFGQRIYVNPAERLVIAQHAAQAAAVSAEQRAMQPAMETAITRILAGR